MPKAQVDLPPPEFVEMKLFQLKKVWTVQKLLRRAVLYYIRNDPDKKEDITNLEVKEKFHE